MLSVAAAVAIYGVLAIFVVRLVRNPHNRALWAVVACLLLQAGGHWLQELAYVAAADQERGDGVAKLTQNVLLHAKYFALALFFLYSVGGSNARKRAYQESALLVITAGVLTAAMYMTLPPLRDHSFSTADMQVSSIATFYLVGGLYFIYILALGGRWAWQYGAESDRRLRAGLRTAAVGLAFQAAASLMRAVFVVVRWFGGTIPDPVNTTTIAMLVIGNSLFIAGLLLALARTQFARVRTWVRHRRYWQRLRPLWEVLYPLYPDATLDPHARSTTRAGERWHAARVHRRFWRRYVECRDGLVQLSPDLAAAGYDSHAALADQAAALHHAVRRQLDYREPYLSLAGYDSHAPVEDRAAAMQEALRRQCESVEYEPDLRPAVPVLPHTDADSDLEQLLTLSEAVASYPYPEAREKVRS